MASGQQLTVGGQPLSRQNSANGQMLMGAVRGSESQPADANEAYWALQTAKVHDWRVALRAKIHLGVASGLSGHKGDGMRSDRLGLGSCSRVRVRVSGLIGTGGHALCALTRDSPHLLTPTRTLSLTLTRDPPHFLLRLHPSLAASRALADVGADAACTAATARRVAEQGRQRGLF